MLGRYVLPELKFCSSSVQVLFKSDQILSTLNINGKGETTYHQTQATERKRSAGAGTEWQNHDFEQLSKRIDGKTNDLSAFGIDFAE